MTPAFIGIDWGTTHRRATLLSTTGEPVSERADGEGALACGGRFRASLEALLAGWPEADDALPVVMAGMVGSAIGWQVVPYLDGAVPLSDLAHHLAPVADVPAGRRWSIVPGYCLGGDAVDVMRGEEAQLFGALHLLGADAADGCYVLPGTHSKWVRLRAGRIVDLRTYMTGELFALLRQHGTLASAMQAPADAAHAASLRHDGVAHDPEFLRGMQHAATQPALAHALFGARARVVTGGLAPASAAAYVSGLLIGAEWADSRRLDPHDEPVRVIGEPALAALHAACAAHHGRRLQTLDARQVQLAAWRAFATRDPA